MDFKPYTPYNPQRTYWKANTTKASNLKTTTAVPRPEQCPTPTNADALAILGKLEAIADALTDALDALDEYLGAVDTEEDVSTEEEDASDADEASQHV